MSLENSILATLAYSDIFDYPLTLEELHRYLTLPATIGQVSECATLMEEIGFQDGFYFLAGRDQIISLRAVRAAASQKIQARAIFLGRILGLLPFVRMVALTGSLAVLNHSADADMDYLVVTQPGRLWTARAFAVSVGRMLRPFGHTICVNLLISENALCWPVHDLYSAREMCQMVPISGMEVYRQLRAANDWTSTILPNAGHSAPNLFDVALRPRMAPASQMLERLLADGRGDRFEEWARNYQMRRIARRTGGRDEIQFTADVCQSHFHNHRRWTNDYFRARLASLGVLEQPQEFAKTPAPRTALPIRQNEAFD